MARTGKSLASLVAELPQYAMVKLDFQVRPNAIYSLLQGFRDDIEHDFPTADVSDGIKVMWPDGWVHVRASQTESMVRIISEASSAKRARDLADWARDRMGTGN
jgi:phosphomannomutase